MMMMFHTKTRRHEEKNGALMLASAPGNAKLQLGKRDERSDVPRTASANYFKIFVPSCLRVKLVFASLFLLASPLAAQKTFDYTYQAPTYYEAEFRLRLPAGDEPIKYVLVLLPGYNGDARSWTQHDSWSAFADEHHCAILACRIVMKGSSHYTLVERWSGKALIETLAHFASETKKPDITTAPLLFWGHSAGGGFSYNFANWKPELVAGFVVVKSALNTREARSSMLKVPGLFVVGETDDADRNELIADRYVFGRRRDALWCFAFEPNVGHGIDQADVLGRAFLRDVIAYRMVSKDAAEISWLGDLKNHEIFAKGKQPENIKNTTWLPNEAFAKTWKTFTTGGKINDK